ncbi:MAG: SDR family NAD(P)-dependent oxidoreductase [Candidatus Hermodarchaeota archaeon]
MMNKSNLERKSVLITGASSGIGRAIAKYLAKQGMVVYACARKKMDIDDLNAIRNIQGLKLDVTLPEDLMKVANFLKENNIKLYALINNAGIATGGPMLLLEEKEVRDCIEVNCMGVVNVTKMVYPFLEDLGRIVNISSIGAKYITPFLAPYHMSKMAMEAYSGSLRIELSPFGNPVIIIRPGAVKIQSKANRFIQRIEGTVYGEAFNEYWRNIEKQHEKAISPEKIAKIVFKALYTKKPRKSYLVPHKPILIRIWLFLSHFGITDRIYTRFLCKHIKREQKTELYSKN